MAMSAALPHPVTALGSTRGYVGKECGGFLLAEAISYTTPLTDAQRHREYKAQVLPCLEIGRRVSERPAPWLHNELQIAWFQLPSQNQPHVTDTSRTVTEFSIVNLTNLN